MKCQILLSAVCVLFGTNRSHAWPIYQEQQNEANLLQRSPVSYSVVPVDGGSTTTAAATETVTQPPITTTLISTLLSTLVMTGSETPQTIVVTLTSTLATTIMQTPAPTTVMASTTIIQPAPTSAAPQESISTTTTTDTSTMSASVTESIVTVTEAPSSTPYDDGMWHTTYYHPVDPATTVILVESISSALPSSSPMFGNSTSGSAIHKLDHHARFTLVDSTYCPQVEVKQYPFSKHEYSSSVNLVAPALMLSLLRPVFPLRFSYLLLSLYLLPRIDCLAARPPTFQIPLDPHDDSRESLDYRQELVQALQVMQDEYFDIAFGTWQSSSEWTGAVAGTHVSATLSSLLVRTAATPPIACAEELELENTINKYFAQTSAYYFNEDAFAIRNEAYDDMLWVVLGWLENIKFMNLRSEMYPSNNSWYGLQFSPLAAHRARIFYELASAGWDTSLCNGGMTWNPRLEPYKNAITNELFISASIAMYLYFPGDTNDSPYLSSSSLEPHQPHNSTHLNSAITAYTWLRNSNMTLPSSGLYADGFHITGWQKLPNGTTLPGTGRCDDLNQMVYTYNQGVILSGSRNLWLTTGNEKYLTHGHELVQNVLAATGWPNITTNRSEGDGSWRGLGRNGVLEEACDSSGTCSQDAQNFKGIFFTHFAEFCRPLSRSETRFGDAVVAGAVNRTLYHSHLTRCRSYGAWVRWNADAARVTRDEKGRVGGWWGRKYGDNSTDGGQASRGTDAIRAEGRVDYRNHAQRSSASVAGPGGVDRYGRHATAVDEKVSGERWDCEVNDVNDRGRGRTLETQMGGVGVLRAAWLWQGFLDSGSHVV